MTAHAARLLLTVLATLSLALAPVGAEARGQAPPGEPGAGAAVQADLLAYGDSGPEVERLQGRLNGWMEDAGLQRDRLRVDGIFGPRTLAAVRAFQAGHDLAVDGIVGPRTRAALDEAAPDGDLRAEDVLSEGIDTAPDIGDARAPAVAVTDVRVGEHDGFDRVTFEIGGEGQAGWDVRYVDQARAQGSGFPVAVEGEAVLSVSLRGIAYPVEPPPGVEPREGPERIPAGAGPVLEVVEDTVFEGHHVFFVGVSGEHPFQVRRFESPQRIVLDVAADDDPGAPGEPPIGDLARCESPEGFAISYPASWVTDEGEPGPACTQFSPEPFDVPVGTDERVAAITAYIDPVPFAEVAAPDPERDAERAATAIDGLQAVRLEWQAGDNALWREGTPITLYAIDLTPGVDEDPRTLFLDTVGLADFDYEANQVVLDRIAHTIEVTDEAVPTADDVVARYEGGGGAFSVEAALGGEQACLRIPPEGEEVCTEVPGSAAVHTVQLPDLDPVLAGVTGPEVFRVTAERRDGSTSTVLTAPFADGDLRGFAFPFDLDAVTRLRTSDLAGAELEVIEPGG